MPIELDHVFICTAPDAPEAEKLVQFGLREGPPNQHPGQGTACRRFAFVNAMIELLWVRNEVETQSQRTAHTLLWERWVGRYDKACPFGVCVRPADSQSAELPFSSWEYRPIYLPDALSMAIGRAGVEEPMWVYMSFLQRIQRQHQFIEHPVGAREITDLALTSPASLRSDAAQKIIENGVLTFRMGETHLLEIEFDGNQRKEQMDFRPHLPLIFHL